jgi:hypothetical protein
VREPLFLLRILPFHNMNVDLSTSRMQQEKIESKRAHGKAGNPRSVVGRPQFSPKIFEISQNSLINYSIHSYP